MVAVLLIERGAELRIGQQAGLQDLRLSHAALIPQRAQLRADDDGHDRKLVGREPVPAVDGHRLQQRMVDFLRRDPHGFDRRRLQRCINRGPVEWLRMIRRTAGQQAPASRQHRRAPDRPESVAIWFGRLGSIIRMHWKMIAATAATERWKAITIDTAQRRGNGKSNTLTRGREHRRDRACRVARSRAG